MNSMAATANTTVITAVNPNVVATALIHMQQQQQQQTHQTQLQTIHQQQNPVNNCLDQSLIDK